MTKKKAPQRMCLGCGEMKPKSELLRIVRSGDGEISIDAHGKKPGRGAYICKNPDCLGHARKKRGLERAFSMKIEDEIYLKLESELNSIE
jgi:hypothetical protein